MNRRIRKKKEKQSLMEYSFELVSEYPFKKRKKIINEQWKMFHDNNLSIKIGYKRQTINE